jgi:hypothetical protein
MVMTGGGKNLYKHSQDDSMQDGPINFKVEYAGMKLKKYIVFVSKHNYSLRPNIWHSTTIMLDRDHFSNEIQFLNNKKNIRLWLYRLTVYWISHSAHQSPFSPSLLSRLLELLKECAVCCFQLVWDCCNLLLSASTTGAFCSEAPVLWMGFSPLWLQPCPGCARNEFRYANR